MHLDRIDQWISHVESEGFYVFAKFLTANDTGLTGGHQYGPLIPKAVLEVAFPELTFEVLQKVSLHAIVDSQKYEQQVVTTWYASKSEGRVTQWGGKRCDLLDPENTGALTLFAFSPRCAAESTFRLRVWVCGNALQADLASDWLGGIDPGDWAAKGILREVAPPGRSCPVSAEDLPATWLLSPPTGLEVINFVIDHVEACPKRDVDSLLLCRRDCEFQVFQLFEKARYLPLIHTGFAGIEDFLALAQTITQSRRSRAGNSLEYHLLRIFDAEGVSYAWQATTERRNKPDFIFPSIEAYHDSAFDKSSLRMLGVKTSCKDRWRQIVGEADRVPSKHLFTLAEGVSENQFEQMQAAEIQLVVPAARISAFPKGIRGKLQTLAEFVEEVR